jgi:ribosomal protein L32
MAYLCFKCGSWFCDAKSCLYCGEFTKEEIKEHYEKYLEVEE